VDHALPAPLFARLAREVRRLGSENLRATYRTTFWFPLEGAPPAALPELAVLALRPLVGWEGCAGVEWWLSRMRTSDVQVDFHRDRDEALARLQRRERHPRTGTVLFLNRCRGGLLAVTPAAPNDANPARAPDDLSGLDLVRPWPNRLAVFPGDATHGVLDANGDVPHGRLPNRTPLRLALIVNGWERRPTEVPRFAAQRHYAALRLQAPGGGPVARRTLRRRSLSR
jgi:hypothetical protein